MNFNNLCTPYCSAYNLNSRLIRVRYHSCTLKSTICLFTSICNPISSAVHTRFHRTTRWTTESKYTPEHFELGQLYCGQCASFCFNSLFTLHKIISIVWNIFTLWYSRFKITSSGKKNLILQRLFYVYGATFLSLF